MKSRKRRILLIDDDASITRLLKASLEDSGAYEVHSENSGTAGLSAARDFRPDLVLLDLIMPDMEGRSVAARMREEPGLRAIPIVYLTATLSNSLGSRVLDDCLCIAKPVRVSDLIIQIEKELQRAAPSTPPRRGPEGGAGEAPGPPG